MDLSKVLAELREELADLDAAIASLEQVPQERPRRRAAAKGQAPLPASAEANSRNRDSA